jgi:hypothetical protein
MSEKSIKQYIQDNYDGRFAGDARHRLTVGDVGFLLEISPINEEGQRPRRKRVEIRDNPVRTAGTLEEMLFGYLEGDRTDVEALGVATVVEAAPNGRGKLQSLWGDEARAALQKLGYPELEDDLGYENEPYGTL